MVKMKILKQLQSIDFKPYSSMNYSNSIRKFSGKREVTKELTHHDELINMEKN